MIVAGSVDEVAWRLGPRVGRVAIFAVLWTVCRGVGPGSSRAHGRAVGALCFRAGLWGGGLRGGLTLEEVS